MARPTPTVTFGSGFDAAKFRDAIRNTMVMGMPNTEGDKATFRWTTQNSYNPESPEHDPYTWTQAATPTFSHADVVVPVAVEFTARASTSSETVLGKFDAPQVIVTVLDVDYALVEGADIVVLGGNTYLVEFVAPPMGLFDVDVYQVYAIARDES